MNPQTSQTNPDVVDFPRATRRESNLKWGHRAADAMKTTDRGQWTHLMLLGGSDLMSFRLRVAQSHLRADMLPSYWSDAALVELGDGPLAKSQAVHVPLLQPDDGRFAAWTNGVVHRPLTDFDDAGRWPNVALIAMPVSQAEVLAGIDSFVRARGVVDALAHVVRWLAYAWGAEQAPNPLHAGYGLPSACLLEALFARSQFDLTPGIESRRSCPESIWAAARRWHEFYASVYSTPGDAGELRRTPQGRFVISHKYPVSPEPA